MCGALIPEEPDAVVVEAPNVTGPLNKTALSKTRVSGMVVFS